jgi:endonuclease YncB( thermonuclease family)
MPPYIAGLIRVFTAAIVGSLSLIPAAAGADAPLSPAADGRARVTQLIDAATLRLADGRIVRLAGVLPPAPADVREGGFAEAARQTVAALVQDRDVVLAFGARRRDRHGRFVAQLWRSAEDETQEVWLQGRLLADGLARVATTPDNLLLVSEMLRIEAEARRAGRGLWSDPAFRVRTPEDARDGLNRFQIVEGRVRAAAIRHGIGYLNFGPDYRTDFTLVLDREALRLMRAAGADPTRLEGLRVRARGWLRSFNGPLIEITHPEQIEVLE